MARAQQVLLKYVVMILNYRYGFDISVEVTMKEGVVLLRSNAELKELMSEAAVGRVTELVQQCIQA